MQITFLIVLFILGTAFGSFLCCQARRLRYHETHKKSDKLGSRSICLHCRYQLKWYDNIPILSWLFLRGKCRKCHKGIGYGEFLSELGVGLAFLTLAIGSGVQFENLLVYPMEFVFLGVALIFILVLSFLAIYDGLYGELPTVWLAVAIIMGLAIAVSRIIINHEWESIGVSIGSTLISVAILGGLYLVLYKISKGKWVGDGDWLLGTAIGLALGSPWLATITLFIANLTACITALPFLKKHPKIHLGPFMVIAFVITLSFSTFFNSLLP